ncbi:hypothetical protein [Candidatus Bathycorpusculum sp.]|jgi:hypothetical protein|uniref:hypothetical protein n=1 Tax=Candidatus Bathycorpusculum sp. TaxID=2994959 RepID=UPI002831C31D|nr:hypothetical protein [Candidatus Termitimicrobium sp.]MCL2686782.1 hypothetical protein [Candidatus Termitimicrobium sp.]
MVEHLQEYLCRYMDEKSEYLKGCLLAALDSQEGYLCLLIESLGTPVPSEDVRYAELLVDAGLFREETKITRNGRNRYKLFYLTAQGRRIAEYIKEEGFDGKIPENAVPAV